MPADRIDIATASDRLMAERVTDAVKKKDVDALAAEFASFRARALSDPKGWAKQFPEVR